MCMYPGNSIHYATLSLTCQDYENKDGQRVPGTDPDKVDGKTDQRKTE